MEGILYFHQGWTDIMNCLALITYYSNIFSKVHLIIRNDSYELLNYYTKKYNNINIIYIDKTELDNMNILNYLQTCNINVDNVKLLFHGIHDKYRKDKYNNAFNNCKCYFVERFYKAYDMPYDIRSNISFYRDTDLEHNTYKNFIKLYGNEYILYHEIIKTNKNIVKVNLNQISNIFFDYIEVIEHATEIHLIDSSWAALIYLLEIKFNLFHNINIMLYAIKNHKEMFQKPKKLDNWIFV